MKTGHFLIFAFLFVAGHALAGDSVVVFNEIMYHPRESDSLEWIELFNQMSVDVDISGWQIEGINYTFPTNSIIAGGSFIVVANDPAELARRGGSSTNIYGPFVGKLSNDGERLRLRNHNGRVMDSLEYKPKTSWIGGSDGSGFALAKRARILSSASEENWTVSNELGGTPGRENFPSGIAGSPILLNEVGPSTNSPFWLELANVSSNSLDLGSYEVQFGRRPTAPFILPAGTMLKQGEYFVFSPETYVPRAGEKVFLLGAGGAQLLDAVEVNSRLIGRSSEHQNQWLFPAAASPGASNIFNFQRDVVIDEICFGGSQTNANWIELLNKGSNSVDLANWKLAGFQFPTNTVMGPGEFIVVARDTQKLQAIFPSIRILGDLPNNLGRSSGHLLLEDAFGNPVNELRYFNNDPWPEFADGDSATLELRDTHADNSKPEAWAASTAPGQWQSYSYTEVAAPDSGPTRWNELVFGLLDAGEVLLDDFSVIENPSGTAREILQNGNFEKGSFSWRFLGTHRQATVVPDPENPTNHVLHLIADGATEHMHNHVESTLVNNSPIKNGVTYKISWRAKWLAGCDKLNTRLYFNRVARTTLLLRPLLSERQVRLIPSRKQISVRHSKD